MEDNSDSSPPLITPNKPAKKIEQEEGVQPNDAQDSNLHPNASLQVTTMSRYRPTYPKQIGPPSNRPIVHMGDLVWLATSDGQNVSNQCARIVGESLVYGPPKEDGGDRECTTRLLQLRWVHTGRMEYISYDDIEQKDY